MLNDSPRVLMLGVGGHWRRAVPQERKTQPRLLNFEAHGSFAYACTVGIPFLDRSTGNTGFLHFANAATPHVLVI
jgi:hypothetical protein